MNSKLSGILGAFISFLAFIALAPPELQNQIPQVFPEKYRGTIALVLAFLAFGFRSYHASADKTADKPTDTKP